MASTLSWGPFAESSPAVPQERQKVPMILSITSILLCVLVLVCIVWNRRRVAPQIWMIPVGACTVGRVVGGLGGFSPKQYRVVECGRCPGPS